MDQSPRPIVGSVVLVLCVLAVGAFVVRLRGSDVDFCRTLLHALATGQPGSARHIDWNHLQALQTNVGQTYAALPSEQERANYRRAFVQYFAEGFQAGGVSVDTFTHWRIHAREAGQVVVAVDNAAGTRTLLMRVTATGAQKLTGLQWQ